MWFLVKKLLRFSTILKMQSVLLLRQHDKKASYFLHLKVTHRLIEPKITPEIFGSALPFWGHLDRPPLAKIGCVPPGRHCGCY